MKWELTNFCEIDKYAIESYCAVHNISKSKNLGNIEEVNLNNMQDFTMVCGGSPCQDFSIAGNQKGSTWTCKRCGYKYNPLIVQADMRNVCPVCGNRKIEKTRSSLLVEFLKIIKYKRPVFGIYENVKNIVCKKFLNTTFKIFIDELKDYGYNVYWKVLNSKNYGIPQNRERVFVIFIDKNIDNKLFMFPKEINLGKKTSDFLEKEVNDKYYFNTDKIKKILECKRNDTKRIYDVDNIMPTLNTCDGGHHQPKVFVKQATLSGKVECNIGGVFDGSFPNSKTSRGRVQCMGKISPTLTTQEVLYKIESNYKVRKLTSREYWRLMGFEDYQYDKASIHVSESQLYKQAGNSIVVDVLYYIFMEIYKVMPYLFIDLKVCSLFSGIGAFESALDRLYKNVITKK